MLSKQVLSGLWPETLHPAPENTFLATGPWDKSLC